MTVQEYFTKMLNIQKYILAFIEDEESSSKQYSRLIRLFDKYEIRSNQNELKSVLHLLSNIATNHQRGPNFFDKIRKIINNFNDEIKNYFSSTTLYNIFKKNETILFFVKKNNDDANSNQMNEDEQHLLEGENHNHICELIRKDMIDEFIDYTKNEKLDRNIDYSTYETNPLLIQDYYRDISLIEYAAFFGSVRIFKYLLEQLKIEHYSRLWDYVIHSRNIELIQILEDKKVDINKDNIMEYLEEPIKCHHNEMVKYIIDKYLPDNNEKSKDISLLSLKYYNFSLIQQKYINISLFFELIEYDYCTLVKIISKEKDFDEKLSKILYLIVYLIILIIISMKFVNKYFNEIQKL